MNRGFDNLLKKSLEIWFAEDIGEGDHTTLSTVPSSAKGKARLLVKDKGIIAGLFVVEKLIREFDNQLEMEVFLSDGSEISEGDIVFEIKGPVRSILQVERLALNLLQRLSGIATQTRDYVERIKGTNAQILDTRKTTPGLRFIEKEAVRLGGGLNHRIGLYDMILIKDNHIDFAGGIENAIKSAKKYLLEKKLDLKIEVEARTLQDVEIILRTGIADRVLLDNFSTQLTSEAVKIINGRIETESSGGIDLNTIRSYAECGVDYISAGALTHQIRSLDLSLKAFF
ncbi:MAG: carboxylating nicotinate-nucleotide diphosphorylase [Bacteroidota bacterium]